MAIFYDEAEMAEERRKVAQLENFLISIGAVRDGAWKFDPSVASGTKEIRQERDKARDEVEILKNDLRLMKGQRDDAEAALISAGHSKQNAGPWTPPAADEPLSADYAAAADRRSTAEQYLHGLGYERSADGKRWRPPVGGVAPALVNVLEQAASYNGRPTACYLLSKAEVRTIAEGLDGLRAMKAPRCFETIDWLNGEVLGVLRSMDNPSRAPTPAEREVLRRAVAAVDALSAFGLVRPAPQAAAQAPGGFPSVALSDPDRRGAFNPSRSPDRITAAQANARMIAFPVLDAIALLAVIDRRSGPFVGATRGAEALGELEQATELWLDARAGGE